MTDSTPDSESVQSPDTVPGEKPRHGIFLVDDHPVTRAGLAALIGAEPDLFICGHADNVEAAWTSITELKPALVVTDIVLKNGSGIELIRKLTTATAGQLVLAISMHDESVYAERAIRTGARGYLMKKEAAEKLIPAIRRVLQGEFTSAIP